MAVVNRLLLDGLGRSPLVQIQKRFQQVVQGGVPALSLHPDVQQLVDPVLVGEGIFALDHVVVDAEVTEESLLVVELDFLKVLEAFPQRLFTCRERPRPSVEQQRRYVRVRQEEVEYPLSH